MKAIVKDNEIVCLTNDLDLIKRFKALGFEIMESVPVPCDKCGREQYKLVNQKTGERLEAL